MCARNNSGLFSAWESALVRTSAFAAQHLRRGGLNDFSKPPYLLVFANLCLNASLKFSPDELRNKTRSVLKTAYFG